MKTLITLLLTISSLLTYSQTVILKLIDRNEVLSHGEHIDVFVRMQELEFIDIPFPETNTPIYPGCD